MSVPIPVIGQSIIDQRQRAAMALRAQNWQEAARLYEQVVQRNPNDGRAWRALGLSLLRQNRFDESIQAYQCALETGVSPATNHYDIACALALSGHQLQAIEALRRAYALGFVNDHLVRNDADLSSLHDAPEFREIVGWTDDNIQERQERWLQDLRFLARRIREVHWRPFHQLSEKELEEKLAGLRASVSSLDDWQLRAQIQVLLASLGDGHSAVVTDFFRMHHTSHADQLRFLPIEWFWYEDGIRVVAASPKQQDLIGARLLGIAGEPIKTLIERTKHCVSRDNEWGGRWGMAQLLADPKLLHGLGYGLLQEGFDFDFEMPSGQRLTRRLAAGGLEVRPRIRLSDALDVEKTLLERSKHEHLWMHRMDRALYVRIDGIRDGHRMTFAEFTQKIFSTAEQEDLTTLILDLRDNLGGQGHLSMPLLHGLIGSTRFNRPGGLYVLVGRKTFSAAMALAAQLELHTQARFVGEPTGSRPNFVGETSIVQLPYSKLQVSISSRYHQNGHSNDERLWIAPDIPASPDFALARQGRDPAMEAVVESLHR